MDIVEVARHFEQALTDVAVAIAPQSKQIGSAVASYAAAGSWLNQCWNFGMDGPVTGDDVDRIIAFYDNHQSETRLGLTTLADRTAVKALAAKGFDIEDFINLQVKSLATDEASSIPTHPTPRGLEIHMVDKQDSDSADHWAELSTSGFNDGEPAAPAKVWTAAQALRYRGVEGYVATMDGVPAGAAAMAIDEIHGLRSAGLFATSVLPPFRGLGIQQHLIARRLKRARELGATFATIGSTPGISTERNARRFGFELGYVKAVLVRPAYVGNLTPGL